MESTRELPTTPLKEGGHAPGTEMCVMEAVAYVAGEPWSDHPQCACPVIAAFLRSWNDSLPSDADRDRLLRPLVLRVVGSRSTPAIEQRRSWLALDWLARVHTPAWLELAGLRGHAALCRGLGEICDAASARSAKPILAAARAAARAAVDAAWAAAGDAAWAAAGDAAWDAAWAAAGDAAWDAGDAAWAAAGDAAVAALQPTVEQLQASALSLLDRMLTL